MFVFGFHAFVWGTTSLTVRQRAVPVELQGRVGSVYLIGMFGGMLVGAPIGGLLARHWGIAAPIWFGFFGSAILVVLLWRTLAHIVHDPEPEPTGPTPWTRSPRARVPGWRTLGRWGHGDHPQHRHHRPIEKVFAYLCDFTNTRSGTRARSDPRLAGDGGVGTKYHNVSKFLGRKTELTYTVRTPWTNEPFVIVGNNKTARPPTP